MPSALKNISRLFETAQQRQAREEKETALVQKDIADQLLRLSKFLDRDKPGDIALFDELLSQADVKAHPDIYAEILYEIVNRQAFHQACTLLDMGASPKYTCPYNTDSLVKRALWNAAFDRSPERDWRSFTCRLLDAGADCFQNNGVFDTIDRIVLTGGASVFKKFIETAPHEKIRDYRTSNNNTLLVYVIQSAPFLASMLLDLPTDVLNINFPDLQSGKPPIMLAMSSNRVSLEERKQIIEKLLMHKADIFKRDKIGLSAVDLAKKLRSDGNPNMNGIPEMIEKALDEHFSPELKQSIKVISVPLRKDRVYKPH